jgi:hypothetical protein
LANLTRLSPVAELDDKKSPQRRVRHPNGVVERLPWGAYFKCVHPSGGVVRIPLHTGRANTAFDDPYRLDVMHRKPRKGFIPYGKCPPTLDQEIQEQHLPAELRGRIPCRTSTSGGPISDQHCCACIEDLIAFRKKEQAERMARVEIKTTTDRQLEAANMTAQAIKGVAEVVERMQSQQQPAPRGRGKADD